jgi:polysaccharide export outer membrane protein
MLILALVLSMAALQAAPAAAQLDPPAAYAIGPEDVLEISVWDNKEISRTVPVRPDGKISLPLLNDVQAAGLAPSTLRDALAKALAEYIPRPIVSVIVREIHSVRVTVIGEVKTPGRYELRSRATVLDVLAMAGGLSQYAARGRITILRRDGEGVRELPFDFDKITIRAAGKTSAQDNFCVEPGDIILVP